MAKTRPTSMKTTKPASGPSPTLRERCADGDLLSVHEALMRYMIEALPGWGQYRSWKWTEATIDPAVRDREIRIPVWLWGVCRQMVAATIEGKRFGLKGPRRGIHARAVNRLRDELKHHQRHDVIARLVAEGLTPDKACVVAQADLRDTPLKGSKKALRASYDVMEQYPAAGLAWLMMRLAALPDDHKMERE